MDNQNIGTAKPAGITSSSVLMELFGSILLVSQSDIAKKDTIKIVTEIVKPYLNNVSHQLTGVMEDAK